MTAAHAPRFPLFRSIGTPVTRAGSAPLLTAGSRLRTGTALACVLAGLTALPSAVQAQDNGGMIQFLGTILLDPAHVRARDPEGTDADRANSRYVADAELERARMGDLRDLFAGIASVSVGGAIPIAQKIFVNGVDMLNLAVTVDGVSQNNRLFHHISANAFDPGLMRFVRVDAGAAPADAGPHAMAGAVVMETVDPGDFLEPGQAYGGSARLSFGSNGETFGRSATAAGRVGMLEWLAYARTATGEDYQAGGGATVEASAADLQTRLVKLAFESDEGHRLEFSAQEMHDDALRPYRANIGSIGRPFPPRRHDTLRTSQALSYERLGAEGLWDPRFVLGRSEVEVGVDQPYDPALGVSRGVTRTLSATLENRFHLSPDATLTAGVDFYDRASRYSDDATAAITETAQNWGIFAQMRSDPTEALSLSYGLRWDRQDFTGTNGWQGAFSGASANGSVSYRATDSLRLRAGISSVFGGLTIEDNFIFNRGWSYAGLGASRAENLTLGFDWERGNLSLDGEVFVTRLNDVRLASYAANASGSAESRGFNLGLGYGWTDGFLRASYAWSEVSVNGGLADSYSALDLGAPLGGVISIEMQHRPQGWNWSLGGSVEAALDYDDVAAGSDQGIPGYGVLNLFAEYHAQSIRGLTLRVELNNVFDTLYADRSTYGADYASITPLYEPGRSLQLTAAMRF